VDSASHDPRFAARALGETVADAPAVLIHGPRQCGKTTLARSFGEPAGYVYLNLDDAVTLAAAQSDPMRFVAELPARVILDEVQRAPQLFPALKSAIDDTRRPGRFLLTGSTNVLLLPKLGDSLAGRMEVLRLHPLAQCELAREPSTFLDHLFEGRFTIRRYGRLGRELAERIVAGGYPAALARASARRRTAWYRDYVTALVQRDVRDLTRITSLDVMPRLLEVAASQTARLFNVSELASPFHVSRPTIKDYVTLLARLFLLEELPPWHSNRLSRLVKTPKLHLCDTGVAFALLGVDAEALHEDRELLDQLAETFVVQELRRDASWRCEDLRFHHFRDNDGAEVDLVVERGRALAGIEIKAAGTVTAADFRGLRKLRDAVGSRFRAGVVLYDGDASLTFGPGLFAVPVRAVWQGGEG
jgi:predicted AAA+ superfamily ATPase